MWGNTQEQTYKSPINSGANLYNALIGTQPIVTNNRFYQTTPTYPAHTNPVEYGSAVGHYPDEQVNPTYSAHTNPVEYGSAVGHYPDELPVNDVSKIKQPLALLETLRGNIGASSNKIKPLVPTTLGLGLGLQVPVTAHIKAGIPDRPKARPAPQVQQAPAMMMMMSSGPQLRVVTGPNGEQSLAYSANHMYNQASLEERRLNELRRQQVLDFLAGKGMTYEQALAQARGY